jgi:hypothetical protein
MKAMTIDTTCTSYPYGETSVVVEARLSCLKKIAQNYRMGRRGAVLANFQNGDNFWMDEDKLDPEDFLLSQATKEHEVLLIVYSFFGKRNSKELETDKEKGSILQYHRFDISVPKVRNEKITLLTTTGKYPLNKITIDSINALQYPKELIHWIVVDYKGDLDAKISLLPDDCNVFMTVVNGSFYLPNAIQFFLAEIQKGFQLASTSSLILCDPWGEWCYVSHWASETYMCTRDYLTIAKCYDFRKNKDKEQPSNNVSFNVHAINIVCEIVKWNVVNKMNCVGFIFENQVELVETLRTHYQENQYVYV